MPLDFSALAERLGIRIAEPEEFPSAHLIGLPPTEGLRKALDILERKRMDYDTEELTPPEVLLSTIRRATRDLRAGEERDRRQAERPDGCWCLGEGGKNEAPLTFHGDEMPLEYITPMGVDRRMIIPVLDSETREPVFGYLTYCGCSTGIALRAEAEVRVRDAQAAYQARKVAAKWGEIGIPPIFNGMTLGTWAATAPENGPVAVKLAGWPDAMVRGRPAWLILSGPNGRGKTGVAAALAGLMLERGESVLFRDCVTLFDQLRAAVNNGVLGDLQRALLDVDTLFLDDLGAGREQQTEFERDQFFRIINTRHDNLLRTVITTNLNSKQFGEYAGERALHRLLEMTSREWSIRLDGPNLRLDEATS